MKIIPFPTPKQNRRRAGSPARPRKRKVTRQRRQQRKHVAEGRCALCSEPLFFGDRCVRHYEALMQTRGSRMGARPSGALGVMLWRRRQGLPLAESTLGQVIREFRAEQLLALQDFALQLDISLTTLNAYEQGKAPLTLPTLIKLAEVMGRTPGELLERLLQPEAGR